LRTISSWRIVPYVWIATTAIWLLAAQQRPDDKAVAVVVNPGRATLISGSRYSELKASPGDLIGPGDRLAAGGSVTVFTHYPKASAYAFEPEATTRYFPDPSAESKVSADLRFSGDEIQRVRKGNLVPGARYSWLWPPTIWNSPAQAAPVLAVSSGSDLATDLKRIDSEISKNPDPVLWLSKAARLEQANDVDGALTEYRKLKTVWPNAAWLQTRVDKLTRIQNSQSGVAASVRSAQTYAVLIGISRFQSGNTLSGAKDDAFLLSNTLRNADGKMMPRSNIFFLSDTEATAGAIRSSLRNVLAQKAQPNDTVFLFVSTYGIAEEDGYLLAYDSDTRLLRGTAIAVSEISDLIAESRVKQILVLADVFRTDQVRKKSNRINVVLSKRLEGSRVQAILSNDPSTVKGRLRSNAGDSFSSWLRRAVEQGNTTPAAIQKFILGTAGSSGSKRRPLQLGEIVMPRQQPEYTKIASAVLIPGLLASPQQPKEAAIASDAFEKALREKRYDDAADALRRDRSRLSPEVWEEKAGRLAAELESAGQQVLLKYLDGDEVPLQSDSFRQAAEFFEQAAELAPSYTYLHERALFFRGRWMTFGKQYPNAIAVLEQAIKLDAAGAYSFNALGIAYLEQGRFPEAVRAFRDCVERAPVWVYPRHNLALAYTEMGDYDAAKIEYNRAIGIAPRYARLRYNEGLLFYRLNQKKEAERDYEMALKLNPQQAEAHVAMGVLLAGKGKKERAERYYTTALKLDSGLLSAGHNLGVLYAKWNGRTGDAIKTWTQVISTDPSYLPSRLNLAELYYRLDKLPESIREYRAALALRPDSVADRMSLARVLAKSGDVAAAAMELQEALWQQWLQSRNSPVNLR
jgi:tetratricopeptide (TPR) repeat protein